MPMRYASDAARSGYWGLSAHSQASPTSELWQMATMMRPLSSRMARHTGTTLSGVYGRCPQIKRVPDLNPVIQVVNDMKDFVLVLQIFDGAIGENHAHPGEEGLPLEIAVRIVGHQETTPKQIFPQAGGLVLRHMPRTGVLDIKPGPVV